jgi:hypothetical protein
MRLWSLHPCLLDQKGLVALWREALLAQHVLQGKTRGYRFHPQLERFKGHPEPLLAIAIYLWAVQQEAARRGYRFDAEKINQNLQPLAIPVTQGQLAFEISHLKTKLRLRDPRWLLNIKDSRHIKVHPLFTIVAGDIEPWERSKPLR